MKDVCGILAVYFIVVVLIFIICLGFNVPFSLAKASGIWACIVLLGFVKRIIFG